MIKKVKFLGEFALLLVLSGSVLAAQEGIFYVQRDFSLESRKFYKGEEVICSLTGDKCCIDGHGFEESCLDRSFLAIKPVDPVDLKLGSIRVLDITNRNRSCDSSEVMLPSDKLKEAFSFEVLSEPIKVEDEVLVELSIYPEVEDVELLGLRLTKTWKGRVGDCGSILIEPEDLEAFLSRIQAYEAVLGLLGEERVGVHLSFRLYSARPESNYDNNYLSSWMTIPR